MSCFTLLHTDPTGARRGRLTLDHGTVETPVFMPVGTQGTVKGLTPEELTAAGTQILLGNALHLYLRPGLEVLEAMGGLHRLMTWDRPILTDSGGFQIFSQAALKEVTDDGVTFTSYLDGSRHFLPPERIVAIQEGIGSDIQMVLDECLPADAPLERQAEAVRRTTDWARRSRAAKAASGQPGLLFGIVQGGSDPGLRERSLTDLLPLDFPGYAIGGLSVGEEKGALRTITRFCAERLPAAKPRYLMGVGTPLDLIEAVGAGIDLFDCVLPTRNGRTGSVFTRTGPLNIKNARFRTDERPLDAACACPICARFSRAYLCHLYRAKEILATRSLTLHNVWFYHALMGEMREAIARGTFATLQAEWSDRLGPENSTSKEPVGETAQ